MREFDFLPGNNVKNLTESKDHETNPVYDPKTRMIYFASWNDKDLGAVYKMAVNNKKRSKISSTLFFDINKSLFKSS